MRLSSRELLRLLKITIAGIVKIIEKYVCRFTFDLIVIEIERKKKIYCSINVRELFLWCCLMVFLAIAL